MTKQRNDSERTRVFNLVKDHGSLTSTMVSDNLGIPIGKAKYYLTALTNEGKLKSLGRGVNGGYTLAKRPYTRKTKPSREELVETVNVLSDPETLDAITQAENWDEAKKRQADVNAGWVPTFEQGLASGILREIPFKEDPSPFETKHVTLNPDMFDKVKHLPFPVGVAALALLENDVVTAQRMLSLTEV